MSGRKKTAAEKGYGPAHQRLRKQWQRRVDAGGMHCWRCKKPINPGDRWDLGHDDNDRTRYRGPECIQCNRGEPSRRKNKPAPHSRTW